MNIKNALLIFSITNYQDVQSLKHMNVLNGQTAKYMACFYSILDFYIPKKFWIVVKKSIFQMLIKERTIQIKVFISPIGFLSSSKSIYLVSFLKSLWSFCLLKMFDI